MQNLCDVELMIPANESMMMVLRMASAGIMARFGLNMDDAEDVKVAVAEAFSYMLSYGQAFEKIHVHFKAQEDDMCIRLRGEGCIVGNPVKVMSEHERNVVLCIFESMVDRVELDDRVDCSYGVTLIKRLFSYHGSEKGGRGYAGES